MKRILPPTLMATRKDFGFVRVCDLGEVYADLAGSLASRAMTNAVRGCCASRSTGQRLKRSGPDCVSGWSHLQSVHHRVLHYRSRRSIRPLANGYEEDGLRLRNKAGIQHDRGAVKVRTPALAVCLRN